MLIDQVELQPGHRVLVWGAAGGLGVFALQLAKLAGADAVGVVSSAEKGELCSQARRAPPTSTATSSAA